MLALPSLRPALPALPRGAGFARLPIFARDFGMVLALMGLYFIGRGQAPDRTEDAVALTLRLMRIEQALRLFREPAVQDLSIRHHWVKEAANAVYAYLHFPVMAAVGGWLWWRERARFAFLRNVLFMSMAIGMVCYYALPAAPPRLLAAHGHDLGFVDTVFGGGTAVHYRHPSLITNEYAALPSFHFGWILLCALAVWTNSRSRTLRAASTLLVVAMAWAIVASANHFFVDMALGALVIWASWAAASRLTPAALSAGRAPRIVTVPAPRPIARVVPVPAGRRAA